MNLFMQSDQFTAEDFLSIQLCLIVLFLFTKDIQIEKEGKLHFMKGHLANWAPLLAKKIMEGSQIPFYHKLSIIIDKFIGMERKEGSPQFCSEGEMLL